jgi:hypothetical protein
MNGRGKWAKAMHKKFTKEEKQATSRRKGI